MKIEGAITALVTPMRGAELDFDALDALVEAQIEAGIDGLVAVGTTGESATLDVPEHIAVVARVVRAARGRVPVIAGAGANATAEALALSRASEDAGADALLHVTPYYNKPTQDGLRRHFETIAAATRLPVVLYNVPARTACDLLPETVARLAEIDNVVAIKEATGDMVRGARIIELCGSPGGAPGGGGSLALLSGDDATTLPLYALGGRGVISVISNVVPDRVAAMWDAVCAGDMARARALHYGMLPLLRLLFQEPNPIPLKAALAMMGRIAPDIRPPLYAPSDGLAQALREQLAAEGLL